MSLDAYDAVAENLEEYGWGVDRDDTELLIARWHGCNFLVFEFYPKHEMGGCFVSFMDRRVKVQWALRPLSALEVIGFELMIPDQGEDYVILHSDSTDSGVWVLSDLARAALDLLEVEKIEVRLDANGYCTEHALLIGGHESFSGEFEFPPEFWLVMIESLDRVEAGK